MITHCRKYDDRLCFLKAVLFTVWLCVVESTQPLNAEVLDRPISESLPPLPHFIEKSLKRNLPEVRFPDPAEGSVSSTINFGSSVWVSEFTFEGNHFVNTETLSEVTGDFENQQLTYEQLVGLRDKLSLIYINLGYVTSGVKLPSIVKHGVVTFNIVEGELGEVHVVGAKRLAEDYIRARIKVPTGEIVNVIEIENRLKIAQLNPLINYFEARLEPTSKPGVSDLNIQVHENKAHGFEIVVGNMLSPAVSSDAVQASFSHGNLSGRGDEFNAFYQVSEGLDEYGLSYKLPLVKLRSNLGVHYHRSDAEAQERPFTALDIESETFTAGFSLDHKYQKDLNTLLRFTEIIEYRESNSFLLGRGFSFSAGADEGVARVVAVRLGQELIHRKAARVIAFRSRLSFGVKKYDDFSQGAEPDGDFISWLGQGQIAQKFEFLDSLVVLKGDFQWANDPLPGLEQYSLGGRSTVRGYRENQVAGDKGWLASVEWRIPLLRKASGEPALELATYADTGRACNHERSTSSAQRLSSGGIGLLLNLGNYFQAEIFIAERFNNLPDSSNERDLQDDGIHFRIRSRF
ncbi:MAG: BamA/TamA family outer membrane protein [Gammaproteobacteria bacterium]|nr:BamA/TamA family outer membrane protein [Gammaproteobacteria bacterium]